VSALADESALLSQLRGVAAQGRYRQVLELLAGLPSEAVKERSPLALLAAEAHGRLGEHDAASQWAAHALNLARGRLDAATELRAVHLQGAIAWQRGAVQEAESHFHHALELARRLQDLNAQARALNNIGILQHLWAGPDSAVTSFTLALAAYQQAGDQRGMAETHHNLAISWRALSNTERARDAADEAVRLARRIDDSSLLGLTLSGRAEVHLELGDPALAAAELDRAAEAYERVRFAAGFPEVYRVRAGVARAQGDLTAAVDLLRRASQLALESAPLHTRAEVERDLGKALLAAGDDPGARAALTRAQLLYHQLGARRAEAEVAAYLSSPA
jgi:tetratricopeptide (TPR) repeat protein